MKKISLFLVLVLVLCSSGCGANTTDFKTPDKISDYQYADFDKFNSPASENGLGGTQIYVDGEFETIFEIEDCFYGRLKSGNNKWCVFFSTASETALSELSFLEGQNARIFGVYQGFAENLDMPMLSCIKITLSDTGECYNNLEFYSSVSTIFETELATAIESGEELNPAKSNVEIKETEFFDLSAYDFIDSFSKKSGIAMEPLLKTPVDDFTRYTFKDDEKNITISIHENNERKVITSIDFRFDPKYFNDIIFASAPTFDDSIDSHEKLIELCDRLLNEERSASSDYVFLEKNGCSYMINYSDENEFYLSVSKE